MSSGQRGRALLDAIGKVPVPAAELDRLRRTYLERQLSAVSARIRMLKGERLTFDEESKALYDAVAPTLPESHFQGILDQLEKTFPGSGPLVARYDQFRSRFVIPRDKVDGVFKAAIQGCRERTLAHVRLPESEQFTIEYVTDKSWSGYNWYQGNFRSLIQVNTDLPIYDRSRGRPGVSRGLSRPSRLQRTARKAPGPGSRLDRVLGVSAVLAPVADRGRHGELRHRGGLPRPGASRLREGGASFPRPVSTRARPTSTTACRDWSIGWLMPATRQRDGI